MNTQTNIRTLSWLLPRLLLAVSWLITETAMAQSARTIVVAGLGGNAEYDEQFVEFSDVIASHARALASEEADVILLQGEQATKQAILNAIMAVSYTHLTLPTTPYV